MLKDINKWKYPQIHELLSNIVRMSALSKVIYRFGAITVKVLTMLFCRSREVRPRIHMDSHSSKTTLRKKKLKDSHFLISKPPEEPSGQCSVNR